MFIKNADKYTYLPAPSGGDPSSTDLEKEAAFRGVNYGFHGHAMTCHKGKAGKWGCRMARPAGLHEAGQGGGSIVAGLESCVASATA